MFCCFLLLLFFGEQKEDKCPVGVYIFVLILDVLSVIAVDGLVAKRQSEDALVLQRPST